MNAEKHFILTKGLFPISLFYFQFENSALKQVLEQYVPSQQEDEPGSHLLFNKRVVCQWIFGS